jgi:iron(III) transport system substrate-binding protein
LKEITARKKDGRYTLFAIVLMLAMVIGACAQATPAPVAEEPAAEAPVAEEPVAEEPVAPTTNKVVIYTPKENEEVAEYIPVAQAALPDLELEALRLSTGDLTARILAEKDNIQNDLIWGMSASSVMIINKEGLLEPYAPKGLDSIRTSFRDPADPPAWVGIDGYVNVFCVNTVMAEEMNLPTPKSWADLLDPVYQGQVVMPDPASSGTGYMFISSVLQGMGEEDGFNYLKELDKNIAIYTKSGSKPCKMAAAGEYAIAISFDLAASRVIEDGAPIELVVPTDGSGWEMEADALMKSAKNPEGAKRFLDWAISDEALSLYAGYFAVLAKDGDFPLPPHIPANLPDLLYPMNFQMSADMREAVIAQWSELFSVKVEQD